MCVIPVRYWRRLGMLGTPRRLLRPLTTGSTAGGPLSSELLLEPSSRRLRDHRRGWTWSWHQRLVTTGIEHEQDNDDNHKRHRQALHNSHTKAYQTCLPTHRAPRTLFLTCAVISFRRSSIAKILASACLLSKASLSAALPKTIQVHREKGVGVRCCPACRS